MYVPYMCGQTRGDKAEHRILHIMLHGPEGESCPLCADSLFGKECTVLPGILSVTIGPCQQVQTTLLLAPASPVEAQAPLKSILEWLEVLGLQEITEVGLSAAGYDHPLTHPALPISAIKVLVLSSAGWKEQLTSLGIPSSPGGVCRVPATLSVIL